MLRLHEELEALMTAAEEKPLIDIAEAERHLALVGIDRQDPVILCAYGATNRFVPKRIGERYDWDQLTLDARSGERDYAALRVHLANRDKKTPNLGFVSCPGGTATKKRDEIKQGRVLIVEIDKEGLDKAVQAKVWEKAGLPPPTFMLDTGGKSVHLYWVLEQLVSADKIREGRARISKAIEDATGFQTDHAMHSPHQPARLAGGIHPKTGQRSMLINVTGINYSFDAVMAACPQVEAKKVVTSSDNLFPDDQGEVARPGEYPEPDELNCPVPLELTLSNKTRELIKTGQQPGEKIGRAVKAWSLSLTFRAAKEQLESLGYQVDGDPLSLYDEFCTNSDFCGLGSLEACRDRYDALEPCGQGELSKSALRRRITKWAEDNGHWKYRPKRFGSGSQGSSKPKTASGSCQADCRHLVDRPLPYRLDFFSRYVKRTVREHRNSFRRLVYAKDVRKKLNLNQLVKDPQLVAMTLEAHDELQGNVFEPLSAEQRMQMDIPTIKWLVPDAIPKNDLTIVGGAPKVGKTNFAVDAARAIARGESFLSFEAAEKNYVILITDDQADGDSAKQMQMFKLWDEPNLSWSRRMQLTESQMDRLLEEIKQHPNCVVILDSLRSATRALGCDENGAELGLILYDIKNAVIDAGGSLILVHHASKNPDATGGEALSGHNAIAGAANTIWTLHHVPDKDKRINKERPERRAVREARSGKGWNLLVTMRAEGGFGNLGSYGEFLAMQSKAEKDDKTASALRRASQDVKDALLKLVEVQRTGERGMELLELMRVSGLCPTTAKTEKDLNTTQMSLKTKIRRWFKDWLVQSLIEEIHEPGGFGGTPRAVGWALTDKGIEMVQNQLEG